MLSLLSHHVFIQQKKKKSSIPEQLQASGPLTLRKPSSIFISKSPHCHTVTQENNHNESCGTHKNKHVGPSRRSTEIHPSAHMPRRVTHPPRLNFFMSPLWLKDGPNSQPFILSLHPSFSLPLCLVLSHLRHCPKAPHMGSMCAATWKRKIWTKSKQGWWKMTHTFALTHTHVNNCICQYELNGDAAIMDATKDNESGIAALSSNRINNIYKAK